MRVGGEFIRLFPRFPSFEMGKCSVRNGGVKSGVCQPTMKSLWSIEDLVRSQLHGRQFF